MYFNALSVRGFDEIHEKRDRLQNFYPLSFAEHRRNMEIRSFILNWTFQWKVFPLSLFGNMPPPHWNEAEPRSIKSSTKAIRQVQGIFYKDPAKIMFVS